MSPDKIFIIVNEKRTSLSSFLVMEQSAIRTVYASGCTALTELKADAAEYVDARGCTALTELKADAAKTVDASGCTALTELKADAAEYVYARGCTALTEIKADAADIDRNPLYVFAGIDARGYVFEGIVIRNQWRVVAGCRNFTIADARLHWGPGGQSDRPDCLALVSVIETEAAKQNAAMSAADAA